MTYGGILWRTEVTAVALLVICASVLAMFTAGSGYADIWFRGTLVFGVIPAAVVGGPAYAYLRYRQRRPLWLWVILLAILPALGFLAIGELWAVSVAAGIGVIVAVGTHLIVKEWIG
jgi:hypothetical protein